MLSRFKNRNLTRLPNRRQAGIYQMVQKWMADDVYDSQLFNRTFDFSAQTSIKEGIRKEVDWYLSEGVRAKNHFTPSPFHAFTIKNVYRKRGEMQKFIDRENTSPAELFSKIESLCTVIQIDQNIDQICSDPDDDKSK